MIGLPPVDLIDDVALALREAGYTPTKCFEQWLDVTKEFVYSEKEDRLRDRFKPKRIDTKTIPVRNKPLAETLNPQPRPQTEPRVGHVLWL